MYHNVKEETRSKLPAFCKGANCEISVGYDEEGINLVYRMNKQGVVRSTMIDAKAESSEILDQLEKLLDRVDKELEDRRVRDVHRAASYFQKGK